jgi:P-type E1-E2 ATPase
MSGLSRAARAGIVVKGAAAIERLAGARTVLLDKTGTITLGHMELADVASVDGLPEDETLRLAASLDRLSAHPLAAALVAGAEQRGLELSLPERAGETPGRGIEGTVDGHRVLVGSARWLESHGVAVDESVDGTAARVYVAVDGAAAAVIHLDDRLRDDAALLVPGLREVGIEHTALVTGDKPAVAERIAGELGIERVYAEQTPEQKLEIVRALQAQPGLRNVVMVGDGINDAPALALADVGIAMGTIGATVASETADAVILVERVDRVTDAVRIGRRALAIARQSVLLGLGASLVAMGFAAAGFLPPVMGALLQEVIDVGVILNALRALRG